MGVMGDGGNAMDPRGSPTAVLTPPLGIRMFDKVEPAGRPGTGTGDVPG